MLAVEFVGNAGVAAADRNTVDAELVRIDMDAAVVLVEVAEFVHIEAVEETVACLPVDMLRSVGIQSLMD